MRRLHTALGAGVLLLAVTACADQSPDVGFGGEPPAPPAQQGPVEPKPEQERQAVPPDAVDASKLPESYPTDVWTQDNGKAVVATGQEGGCSKVHAEVAEQNDQQVRIVLVDETPEPAGACTMDLRYPPVAVALDEELGDRTVVLEQRDVKVPREEPPN
ncbi:hypothetical protein GIY23_07995 [Allosaccharopolyspora coralli]|uniref:Lipoprotein n=1 Tax=Allosaccharopolyspora coralli TaxID=2665642 RepID=A0A5Q3QD40_9PSEU|nr:hypothetical protein GIY23_07995 [Allosaccharopolyspora coralli]